MTDNYTVYRHIFPNNKIYIGITSLNVKKRWGRNGIGYNKQTKIKNAIQKYGWENIKHEILFECLSKEEAEQKEIELIAYYKSNNDKYGYNIANGGNSNGKHSEETRKKISKINKGNIKLVGIKRSEETKQKLRESGKKRIGKLNPMYGKHLSKEAKIKISKIHKGKKISTKTKEKMMLKSPTRKKVKQYNINGDFIKEWESIKQAGRELKISHQCISKAIKENGYAKGFLWKL